MKRKKSVKNNLGRKKGFTLIEIIISIVLIVLIGGTATFLLVNKKNDDEINKINNQILEAANVYVNTMKDKNGKSFLTEISKGAKGVKIPISLLVDKGLIDEKVSKDLEKFLNNKKDNKGNEKETNESYYILYLQGGTVENENYCEQGPITIASWTMKEEEPIYLCNDYGNKSSENEAENTPNIVETQKSVHLKVSLDKFAVSQDFYNSSSRTVKNYLTASENGVFTYYNEDTKKIYYYYRGAVDNNYLKFGKYASGDKRGQELYWRIIWINDNNEMKIVLDENIPLYFKNTLNQNIPITPNLIIHSLSMLNSSEAYYFFNPTEERSQDESKGVFYVNNIYKISSDKQVSKEVWESLENIDVDKGVYTNNTFWTKNNETWYKSTNLNTNTNSSYILNKNLCSNSCSKESSGEIYYSPSDDFECSQNTSSGCKYVEYEASPGTKVGFLTYGDLMRAGVISSNKTLTDASFSLKDSENYLTDSIENYNILLADKFKYHYDHGKGGFEEELENYSYNALGIFNGDIRFDQRNTYTSSTHPYYTLLLDGKTLIDNCLNWSNGQSKNCNYYRETFIANALKPTLTIDMSKVKLSNAEGTKDNPFELVGK